MQFALIIGKTVRIKIGMRYFTTAFEKHIDDYISLYYRVVVIKAPLQGLYATL